MRPTTPFYFKQFTIHHDRCAHKVGTDGVLLGAWVEAKNPQKILDVGTGSGVIALMMAQRFTEAQITAIELDQDSFEQACENAANSPFADRVKVVQGDFLKYDFQQKFDLIVSNPPFFKGVYSSGNQRRDQARHESALPQKEFLEKVVSLLNPDGKLAVVLPKEEAQTFIAIAKQFFLHSHHLTVVFGRPKAKDKRWLVEMGFVEGLQPKETALTIRNEGGGWSESYKRLTQGFHPEGFGFTHL